MKKNSLAKTGLSLSQAQSISNLCHQRAIEIAAQIFGVNNYSKSINIDGERRITVEGRAIPENIVDLLINKSKLHACQAFLMENIKAKDAMLEAIKKGKPSLSEVKIPDTPNFIDTEAGELSKVDDNWGWEQLTASEMNEYFDIVAHAAHIGQFINRTGELSELRRELPTLPAIDWMVIKDGEKTPVTITKHHTSEGLLKLHEELAAIHREKEQRVNYFKAKVKNLVTIENARIAKVNADLQNSAAKTNNDLQASYETELRKANEEGNNIRTEFEKQRQKNISEIAPLRISVDPRFQETVNEFLTKLPDNEE